jgi:hypothetical protein
LNSSIKKNIKHFWGKWCPGYPMGRRSCSPGKHLLRGPSIKPQHPHLPWNRCWWQHSDLWRGRAGWRRTPATTLPPEAEDAAGEPFGGASVALAAAAEATETAAASRSNPGPTTPPTNYWYYVVFCNFSPFSISIVKTILNYFLLSQCYHILNHAAVCASILIIQNVKNNAKAIRLNGIQVGGIKKICVWFFMRLKDPSFYVPLHYLLSLIFPCTFSQSPWFFLWAGYYVF